MRGFFGLAAVAAMFVISANSHASTPIKGIIVKGGCNPGPCGKCKCPTAQNSSANPAVQTGSGAQKEVSTRNPTSKRDLSDTGKGNVTALQPGHKAHQGSGQSTGGYANNENGDGNTVQCRMRSQMPTLNTGWTQAVGDEAGAPKGGGAAPNHANNFNQVTMSVKCGKSAPATPSSK